MSERSAASPARALELCRAFLKSFGQTVKLLSLYNAGHPVPTSAQQESWHLLHEIFAETGWEEATFSLTAGRWLANERVVEDSARAYEVLAIAFRAHALQSVTFKPDCRLYEYAALCELAATPPNRAYRTDAADFLRERGVRHISANVEEFVRARRVALPASPIVAAPPKPPPPPPPAPPPAAA
ncbi:MAG: hypothetical protein KGM24_04025, partial [Elusimicrobia bacterium]|nr:hypothetical protein [Elusimicrobiota bacterium]